MDSSDGSLKGCFLISNYFIKPEEIKKASKIMLLVLQRFYNVIVQKSTCFVSQVLLEDQKGWMLV